MTLTQLVHRSLVHFWRTNLAVVLGVGVAVAVLAGALLVGESVRDSLRRIAAERQGRADVMVASIGYFRDTLAEDIGKNESFPAHFTGAAPLLVAVGTVEASASSTRAAGITVYGVDERFWRFHGLDPDALALDGRDAWLSPSLATELAVDAGDSIVLALEQPSNIPRGLLQGRREGNTRSIRLVTKGTLAREHLGEFSLRPQQGAVRAVFAPLARLQADLDRRGRLNTLLLSVGAANDAARGAGGPDNVDVAGRAAQLVKRAATLADVGVIFRQASEDGALVVESQAGLMSDALVAAVDAASAGAAVRASSVLTYLANTISSGSATIPYSTVAALDASLLPSEQPAVSGSTSSAGASQAQEPPPLWLNPWAASDLAVKVGDPIVLDYFIWNDDDGLESRTATFRYAGVMDGPRAFDPTLTPDYPGLTDQLHMADWDPPFPVDLTKVRRVDEDYWAAHRAAPKGFVTLEDGQRLWKSKYGARSSTRFYGAATSADAVRSSLGSRLAELVDTQFAVVPLRDEREQAAQGTTDFGEYFVYFSFFLVVSALLLAALFYRFGVEQRVREIGLLTSVGFSRRQVLQALGLEGAVLAAAGTVIGLFGAWAFAALVVLGLRTWWVDAVGTTALDVHVGAVPLLAGAIGGLLAATASLIVSVAALTRQSARSLVAGVVASDAHESRASQASPSRLSGRAVLAAASGTLALGLVVASRAGAVDGVAGFFGAGLLLLVCGLLTLSWQLRRPSGAAIGPATGALLRLGARALTHRPGRTTSSVALVAVATFVIVSVTAFRKDGAEGAHERVSGTGGYDLIVETAVPLMHDPATSAGRTALNLTDAAADALARGSTARLRLRPGDDASCLNLYRPTRPRIMGVPDVLGEEGRFRFGSTLADTDEERASPWRLLRREFPDGAIPAIVDANSLTYVFHLSVGDDIVLPPEQGRQVRLRVVGTLVDSMFQSEVLVGDEAFQRAFPSAEGFSVFLFELDPSASVADVEAAIERQWRDFGADAVKPSERLASFHRVENTYLATFQTLGALGLLLGVVGLALVLARNILERQRELGLLRAVGFESSHLRTLVISETAAMLVCGLATGALAAFVAIAPAVSARSQSVPVGWLMGMGLAVFVAGLGAAVLASSLLTRLSLLRALRSE